MITIGIIYLAIMSHNNLQTFSFQSIIIDESGLKRFFVAKLFVVKNFYSDINRNINNELTAVVKFPPPRF
ncbi:hypothetical protein DRJ25_05785 [Candidatus Woesearchaeota archaeon]|nr:MAG: hypothetical protein DRJ25_05785 [Candidatus Woesearchaeota archaeon]